MLMTTLPDLITCPIKLMVPYITVFVWNEFVDKSAQVAFV